MTEVYVYIDSNEASSAPNIAQKLAVAFNTEIMPLDSGDYVFGNGVAVERKEIRDFIHSVEDGRLWNQLGKMNKEYKKPTLLIEGPLSKPYSRSDYRKYNSALGAIISIWNEWTSIRLMWSDNEDGTIALLKRQAVYTGPSGNKPRPRGVRKAYSPAKIRRNMLQCIGGVGPKTSKNILKKYPDFIKLTKATVKGLKSVKGMNEKKAKLLHSALR